MSVSLILSIEQTLTWACFRSLLNTIGFQNFSAEGENYIRGELLNSDCFFAASEKAIPEDVYVENYSGPKWQKKITVRINYGASSFKPNGLLILLQKIIEITPAAFVLSWEVELLYAYRDQGKNFYNLTPESPIWLRGLNQN